MEPSSRRDLDDPRLSDFALLWALGTLIHLGHTGRHVGPWSFETAAACFVAFHPRSRAGLLALVAIQLVLVVATYPHVANHTVLVAFVDIVVIGELVDPRRASVDRLVAQLRTLLVVAYAWAAFHKLNRGFLDPATSCAVDHAGRLARVFGGEGLSADASLPVIVAVLALEIGVPLALALRRTRGWGVVAGLGFHLLLGFNGFEDFSAIAAALLVASLAVPLGGGIVGRVARRMPRFGRHDAAVRASLVVAMVVGLRLLPGPRMLWFPCWALGTTALLVAAARSALGPNPSGKRDSPTMSAFGLVAVGVFVLNGATPYLGLKTDVSLAMFSNLRSEGVHWNHLLVPPATRVFDQQDELVMVLGVMPERLASSFGPPRWLPELELRMLVHEMLAHGDEPLMLVVARGSGLVLVPDAAVDPELGRAVPPWVEKLTRFREIPARPEACTH